MAQDLYQLEPIQEPTTSPQLDLYESKPTMDLYEAKSEIDLYQPPKEKIEPKKPEWLTRAYDINLPESETAGMVHTASAEYKGKEILFPTVRMRNGQLQEIPMEEAYQEAINKRDFLSFDTPEEATQYSKELSQNIGQERQRLKSEQPPEWIPDFLLDLNKKAKSVVQYIAPEKIDLTPEEKALPEIQRPKELDLYKPYRAATEAAGSIATGMVGMMAGGLAGIGAGTAESFGTDVDPVKTIEKVQSGMTYQPKEPGAFTVLEYAAKPFEWWRETVSKPLGEKTGAEKAPLASTAVYTTAETLPYIFLPKVARGGAKATGKALSTGAKVFKAGAQAVKSAPERLTMMKQRYITEPAKAIIEPVQEAMAPISTGGAEGRIAAKTYANNIRMADSMRGHIIGEIDKNFTKIEKEQMANALIDEELAVTRQQKPMGGFETLNPKQKEYIGGLMERHKQIADKAVEMGILKESKDIYFPRKTIEVLDSKALDRIESSSGLKVSTKHAKKRKYETVAETEAAASELLGKEMKIVKDIRVLPLVTNELEKAIAGKTLINEVRKQSKILGADTVIDRPADGFFTLDHPAMKEWKPRLIKDEQTGKYRAALDEKGDPIFAKQPIYIHESFKGPLKAILNNESGKIMQAFANLKAKSMTMIMFNPLMHGMVIWGKALPFQPWRTFTFRNYAEGRKIYNGPEAEKWITHATEKGGQSPIGNQGWMQRMNDIMTTPQLTAGRSFTAKIAGQLAKPFGKQEAAMSMIDKAGHFWHDTLLWEPIRHMQMGLYKNLFEGFVKKGMGEDASAKLAGHLSNRFAGSVPFEDMGAGLRSTTNFVLFSRTFNATNIGIYKDALKGLPRAVQDQILKTGSELDLKMANNTLKKAAIATLAKDIMAMYVLNSMLQNLFDYMRTGDSGEIAKEYADNLEAYKEKVNDNPMNAFFDLHELTAQSLNEPGKENRIFMGLDPYHSGVYLRNPIGKIGEDLQKFATSPLAMATDKLSPTMKFLAGVATNDKSINKGYNLPVYDKNAGLKDAPEAVGKLLMYFVQTHTPSGFVESVVNVATGNDPTGIEAKKVAGELAGFAVSKGAPAGPAMGEAYKEMNRHKAQINEYTSEIIKKLRLNQTKEAMDIALNKAHMTPPEIKLIFNKKLFPQLNEKVLNQVFTFADKAESKRIIRQIKKYYKQNPPR